MKPTDPPSPKASAGQDPPSSKTSAHDDVPHHYSAEELHNVDVAYEHSDINIRAILSFAVGLAIVAVVVHFLMGAGFWLLDRQAVKNEPQVSPLAPATTQMPARTTESPYFGAAPAPQLLTNEPGVLGQHRQKEEERLTKYDWVDQTTGVARMPIEQAKKLLLERGIPSRKDGTLDPRLGTRAPASGESSSGRTPTGTPHGSGLPDVANPPQPAHGDPKPHKGG
jgi:hypothetical protein